MNSLSYDVVVIGAGGVGAATAYHLAKDGRRVLLLEQFRVGHKQGSSHGASRIIRYSHSEREYASLAPDAFALWRALEAESGADLVLETGSLDFGPADLPSLQGRIATMAELGYTAEVLDQAALAQRFPQFRFPADWVGFYQPNAGIVNADRAVATMAAQAVRHGAVLQEESRVRRVSPHGDGVIVEVDGPQGNQTIHAAQAVITAGPWAGRFFDQLGVDLVLGPSAQGDPSTGHFL